MNRTEEHVRKDAAVLELVDATTPSLRDRSQAALESVNWRVNAGDFWAIAGLAHSGKTNLMMVAAGVLRPIRGSYLLFGREYSAGFEPDQLSQRLKVGMVFDGGQLLQHLTLAENVALPLSYHLGEDVTEAGIDERLGILMEFIGAGAWARTRPSEVNRNLQQRIGLARALALKPELLLLDNPLSGLDPRDTGWWLQALGALASGHPLMDGRPLTLVVTGDDLRPWRHRAGRFGVLSDRRFIDIGQRGDLDLHPEPLLRELLPAARPAT